MLWLEAGPTSKPSVEVQIQIPREGSVPAVLSVFTVCRINAAQRPRPGHTHSVPEGVRSDRVLGGQRAAAEDDEDEDEVGEDVMVDQGVTAHTDPGGRRTDKDHVSRYLHTLFEDFLLRKCRKCKGL